MSGQRKKEYLVIRPASGPHPNPLPKGEGVFQQSYSFVQLITKEWRELFVSRSFWLLLLMIGPLVGHGFITAVNLYAEASGIGGGPAALPQGLTPLDGVLAPTLGAYDLAATFLSPFVAIRMIAAEKQSGGLKVPAATAG